MIEQILLSSSRFEGVRETGGFGQPLHALYPQIRAVLAHDVEPDAAFLLAEPVVDRAKNRIDWYTEGDPDDAPVALSSLSDPQQQATLERIDDLLSRGRALAERYATSDDARKAQVGAVLRAVLVNPAKDAVFLVQGRPVMTGWGFEPDRPWKAPEGSGEPSPTPREPLGASAGVRENLMPEAAAMAPTEAVQHGIALPEVAIPELATRVPDSAALASASAGERKPHIEEVAPPPSPAPSPSQAPLESVSSESVETGAHRSESRRVPLESASTRPAAAVVSSSGEPPDVPPASASLLRYVVVGSHYFWGVVLLAFVLLLLAAYWGLGRKAVSSADMTDPLNRSAIDASDGTMAGALRDAQRMEGDLRGQLERLLVQVAEQRGQCVLPTGGAGAVIPEGATRTSGGAGTVPSLPTGREQGVPPSAMGETSKTTPSTPTIPSAPQSTDRLRPENGPRGQQPTGATPSVTGVAPDPDIVVGTKAIPGTGVAPGPGTTPMTGTPTEVNPTRRTPAPLGAEASSTQTGSPPVLPTPSTPLAPPSVAPSVDATKTDPTKLDATKTDATKAPTSPPATPSSPRSASGEPIGRTLEDSLMEQGAVKTPSSQQTPPVTPPTKAEPTPDERKEFANRMSETGATTGETTVTLLWNSHADLDLVVRCPSGQQLDFRNPAGCGGTLDVDANATRSSLSERPVENAFWPASKAAPGAYEIAVRYVPRKDEERSQETSFQVRLSRGGQESVFKGTVQPHAVVPITTFTVKR